VQDGPVFIAYRAALPRVRTDPYTQNAGKRCARLRPTGWICAGRLLHHSLWMSGNKCPHCVFFLSHSRLLARTCNAHQEQRIWLPCGMQQVRLLIIIIIIHYYYTLYYIIIILFTDLINHLRHHYL